MTHDKLHCSACGDPGAIFVFGSNLAGVHGAGAALHARGSHGAVRGRGVGKQGGSFAIPTKDAWLQTLPLDQIRCFVSYFLLYVRTRPDLTFHVTRIGCGLAGYEDSDIAPMFRTAEPNVILPDGWRE